MELGKAYIGIHADGTAFPAEAEAEVDTALRSIQATADEAFTALQARSDEAFGAVAARAQEAFKVAGSEIDAAFGVTADGVTVEADRMATRIAALAGQIETEMGGASTAASADWNAFASMFAEDAARVEAEAATAAAGMQTIGAGAAGAGAEVATAVTEAATALARLDGAEATAAEGMAAIGAEAQAAAAKTVASMDEAAAATARASSGGLLGGVGAQLKGIAPLAAGFGVVEAIKGAGDLQSNLVKLSTTAGESAGNLNLVRAGVIGMSNDYGISSNKIAQAMYTVDGANFHGAESLLVMKAAVQGAVQEHADLGKVVDAVTTTLHDYGLKATDASDITSKLIAATSTGKISFEALTGALHSVEPAAAIAHMSVGETAADLAAMTASGMSAQQASDNLNGALRNFERPSMVMQKNLADVGLNAQDLRDHLGERGLSGTLQLISDHINTKMGPDGLVARNILNENKAALEDLNTQALAIPGSLGQMAQGLLTGQTDYATFYKAAKETGGQTGAMAQQFAAAYKANDGFSQTLKSGQPLLSSYLGVLAGAVGTQDAMTVALQLTGDHAGAVNDAIAKTNGAVGDAKGNIAGWTEVQGNFNLQLGRAEQAVVNFGIGVAQKALPYLTQFAGWIADKAIPALGNFGHALSEGWNSSAFQILLGIVGTVGGVALDVLKGLGNVLGPLAHAFGELPAPVQLVAGALVALKAASAFGVFEKMAASNSTVISGLGKTAVAVSTFRSTYTQEVGRVGLSSEEMAAKIREASLQGEAALAELFTSLEEVQTGEQKVGAGSQAMAGQIRESAQQSEAALTGLLTGLEQVQVGEGEVVTRAQAVGTAFAEVMPRTAAAVDAATTSMSAAWGRVAAAAAEAKIAAQEASMSPGQAVPTMGAGNLAGLRAGASAAAQEVGTTAAAGLRGAVGGLVGVLGGPLGISMLGATALFSKFSSDQQEAKQTTDQLAAAIVAYGDKSDQVKKMYQDQYGGQAPDFLGKAAEWLGITSSMGDAEAAAGKLKTQLSNVQTAEQQVSTAQDALNAAIKGGDPSAIAAASSAYADAQFRLAQAQQQAADATKTHTQKMQDQAALDRTAADSQFAAKQAMDSFASSMQTYNQELHDGHTSTADLALAQDSVTQSALSAADAAGKYAADQAAANGVSDTTHAKNAAVLTSLEQLAQGFGDHVPAAIANQITALERSDGAYAVAAAAVENLHGQITVLPDGKTVKITAPTDKQVSDLKNLGYTITTIPGTKDVYVQADTQDAQNQLIHLAQLAAAMQTFTLTATVRGPNGHAVAQAAGGIVHAYAAGGFEPMDANLAQVVPPQTWRVVGDRMANDEAFIPIDGSGRSKALWAETGRRLGMGGGSTTSITLAPSYQLPASAPPELVGAIVAANIQRDLSLALAGTGVSSS